MEKYREIIDRPHPVSKKRPQMSRYMRSAQFAPYAALAGYDAVVRETARVTDRKIRLNEYEIAELNRKMQYISDTGSDELYAITYFEPDKTKNGGAYLREVDRIKNLDSVRGEIVTLRGVCISMREIISIEEVCDES